MQQRAIMCGIAHGIKRERGYSGYYGGTGTGFMFN